MRQLPKAESWVVYETPPTARQRTMQFVCELGEWEALKCHNPALKLIFSGITNEGEAERAARDGTAALKNAPRKYR
jgi:hypothetical protein